MLTKFNDSNNVNTVTSDSINLYINDGFHIDAKESMIDREKDKDCTFKAVLKKDVDGIECKVVIKLSGDDKCYTYNKVETVGDTVWSEETRSFKSSSNVIQKEDVNNKTNTENTESTKDSVDCKYSDEDWVKEHRKRMKRISDKYGFNWDWLYDEPSFNKLDDVIKTDKRDTKKKVPVESLVDHRRDEMRDSLLDLVNFIFGK